MMTNQEIIDVVTAAMNGKTILRKGRWVLGNPSWDVVSPSVEWDFVGYDYMVKPEPRTMLSEQELIEIAASIEAENMEMESEDWYRLCEILLERAIEQMLNEL